jgi:hypothetical protein
MIDPMLGTLDQMRDWQSYVIVLTLSAAATVVVFWG